jgi:hypothetical protein
MEAVSSHFDHVTGRHVVGYRLLTLGLATEEAFLPLDSPICISQGKPEMASHMMKRAIRSGIEVDKRIIAISNSET